MNEMTYATNQNNQQKQAFKNICSLPLSILSCMSQ